MELDILAISPHPDDAEIFCGGTLAKMSKHGYKTGLLDLTKGEMGTQGTIEKRAAESEAATKKLSLGYRGNLGLKDAYLDSSSRAQIDSVVLAIRKLKPKLILAPYWEDRHPDHVECSLIVKKAVYFAGLKKYPCKEERFVTNQIAFYQMRYTFVPSFIVDISEVYQQKLDAINCYQSQVKKNSNIQTLINSPLSISSITARDEYCGAMIGAEFGEPFLITNSISINDPVSYFIDNPGKDTLIFNQNK